MSLEDMARMAALAEEPTLCWEKSSPFWKERVRQMVLAVLSYERGRTVARGEANRIEFGSVRQDMRRKMPRRLNRG